MPSREGFEGAQRDQIGGVEPRAPRRRRCARARCDRARARSRRRAVAAARCAPRAARSDAAPARSPACAPPLRSRRAAPRTRAARAAPRAARDRARAPRDSWPPRRRDAGGARGADAPARASRPHPRSSERRARRAASRRSSSTLSSARRSSASSSSSAWSSRLPDSCSRSNSARRWPMAASTRPSSSAQARARSKRKRPAALREDRSLRVEARELRLGGGDRAVDAPEAAPHRGQLAQRLRALHGGGRGQRERGFELLGGFELAAEARAPAPPPSRGAALRSARLRQPQSAPRGSAELLGGALLRLVERLERLEHGGIVGRRRTGVLERRERALGRGELALSSGARSSWSFVAPGAGRARARGARRASSRSAACRPASRWSAARRSSTATSSGRQWRSRSSHGSTASASRRSAARAAPSRSSATRRSRVFGRKAPTERSMLASTPRQSPRSTSAWRSPASAASERGSRRSASS